MGIFSLAEMTEKATGFGGRSGLKKKKKKGEVPATEVA